MFGRGCYRRFARFFRRQLNPELVPMGWVLAATISALIGLVQEDHRGQIPIKPLGESASAAQQTEFQRK
jgi:hypothetical protein